jgi:hypothetical protein
MTFTEQDKPMLREIAREVAKEVIREHEATTKGIAWDVVKEHISTCPVRYEMKIGFLKLALLLTGSGTVGGLVSKLLL